jgi:flagellar motor switch protein FliG
MVGMIAVWSAPAWALPTADEQAAIARRRSVVVAQSRQEVEALFSRLCPGRCELIEINPIFAEPKVVGEVTPGFDGEGAQAFDVELKRIEVLIMLDSTLPKTFSVNIPRMITSKLTPLTPNVLVQPISLEFPQPQLPPQPPIPEEPAKKAAPPPEPPKAAQPPPEPPKKEEPAPEPPRKEEPPPKPWWRELWEVMLPWLPYMLMAGILVALLLRVLNQLREIAQSLRERDARGAAGADAEQPMPDAAALRQELKQSRAAQNEVLRTWLADDPAAVAALVRLVGPDILADLKQDPTLKAPLAEVSRQVAQSVDPLTAQAAQRTAREARARLAAAQITLREQALGGSWDFMHGMSLPALQRVLSPLSGRDKGFVIAQLPPALRSAYMGQLHADERRELFLNAGAGAPVSRDEAIALATKLRQAAEDTAHIGAEAGSQAAIVLDMLAALTPEEQEDTLRELSSKRPEVARAVLDQVCLEGAVAHAPTALVADAMIRTPITTLVALMRGTRPDVSAALMRAAPVSQRAVLASELGLETPVSRSEYLNARAAFLQTLSDALRRDGQDLAQLNVRALQGASQPTQERGGA